MATYYTHVSPVAVEGMLMQSESTISIGTSELYGSLDRTAWTYTTYYTFVGLKANEFWSLGIVESLEISLTADVEPLESANMQGSTIYNVTGEEATVSVGIQQFDARTIEVAMATGVMHTIANERLITFGGGCSFKSRPISISSSNVGCDAPAAQDVGAGVQLIVVTLYDCICTSGLPWSDIQSGEINSIDLEFTAKPVMTLAKGNRLGSIYIS